MVVRGGDYLAIMEALPNITFVSFEPVSGKIVYIPNDLIDFVIVGADSRKHNPIVPKKEWIKSIKHDNIYFKSNIKRYL